MNRRLRLRTLSVATLWHAFKAEPGTEARRIRDARARRIKRAYWVEEDRVEAARLRRLAAYLKRSGKVAA
ncbi:hypothetical protein [Deinococcus wulumuqiensis]|uniref:hypothetical protein n=1 Tax=Deinococcus wulumuqiensis TaxID=980427 RepID=UPI00242D6029|nr:hypothetical protein [Deinococcus wulumuqiensis]